MTDAARVEEAIDRLLTEHPPNETAPAEFWGAQYDAGLAWVWHEEGSGGLGVDRSHHPTVMRRLTEGGADTSNRRRNVLGIGMGAGVLSVHGRDEQRQRWLRPMFTMDEIWCQLFSEPGAGSDLADLSTSAVRDGDEWILNGQKVWTTLAHVAKWGLIIARTDPDAQKHRGLTYFVVDMEAEGVEVRPLYQITGEAEFNEVFFSDTRVPDDQRIDDVGAGWRVAMTTLMNERVAIGGTETPRGSGAIAVAVDAYREPGVDDPVLRARLLELWAESEAARLTTIRANETATVGTPGPEGSTGKLSWAELNKEITAFTVELMGLGGTGFPGGYELTRPTGMPDYDPMRAFLRARANSIEGGTSEIMRNIIGERVLGLPGEPRVDKDLPWREVPRS